VRGKVAVKVAVGGTSATLLLSTGLSCDLFILWPQGQRMDQTTALVLASREIRWNGVPHLSGFGSTRAEISFRESRHVTRVMAGSNTEAAIIQRILFVIFIYLDQALSEARDISSAASRIQIK